MEMPQISRSRALAYLVAVVALLAVGGRFLVAGDDRGAERPAAVGALVAEPAPARQIVVHVVGAVRRPGLYELAEGSRVDDAIEKAGGSKPKAALELVNLAAPVADGQQIVVPTGAETAAAAKVPGSAGADAPAGPVSLNSATLEQLDALPGIGPVTAQRILDYRTVHGAFQSVDELDAVPGIGPARLEQLRPLVAL
jgi:competence protein ComEA